MGSTIMQPKLSGYQANLEKNSLSSNQNSESHEGGLSQSFSAENLKHIIHDLNHHLMLIGLSADNLAGYSQHDNHACENARILRRNLDQVSSILANLFANDEEKHEFCALGWAQLDMLLQRQKYDWQLLAGEDIALTIIVEPFENYLHLEPMALMRVLTNFVHNAVDALREKHSAWPEGQQPYLSITCQSVDNRLAIHVKDNGNGIKAELRGRLFEAGQTSKNTTKQSKRGFGLSSVQTQLARWAGQAQLIASSKEAGSHFVLSLPLHDKK